jgi:hypothetical protein
VVTTERLERRNTAAERCCTSQYSVALHSQVEPTPTLAMVRSVTLQTECTRASFTFRTSKCCTEKGKGKFLYITCHEAPQSEYRCSSTHSLTSALDGGGWLAPRPARFTPGNDNQYPLYRGLCGPQGRSGRECKNLAPVGIRPPDRPVFSESLYRLSYPGPKWLRGTCANIF